VYVLQHTPLQRSQARMNTEGMPLPLGCLSFVSSNDLMHF